MPAIPASARKLVKSSAELLFHIGARVMPLAGAEELLVSSTVKDLVAGSGLRFMIS
jgi:hypothetical protein